MSLGCGCGRTPRDTQQSLVIRASIHWERVERPGELVGYRPQGSPLDGVESSVVDVPDYVGANEHRVHDPVDLTLLNAGWERLGQVSVDVSALMLVHEGRLAPAHRLLRALLAGEACVFDAA